MTISLAGKIGGGGGVPPYFNESLVAESYITDRYYQPTVNFNLFANRTPAADIMVFVPFIPFATHTFTKIALINRATSDSGEKIRLGIYNSSDARPTSLLLDAGEITLDATIAIRAITISQSLTANTLYFLAFVCNATMTVLGGKKISGEDGMVTPLFHTFGFDSYNIGITDSDDPYSMLAQAHPYGVLPATATPDQAVNNGPIIFMGG